MQRKNNVNGYPSEEKQMCWLKIDAGGMSVFPARPARCISAVLFDWNLEKQKDGL